MINDVFNRRSAHRPIERLCELLQRFPLFKQILGRFAAKRDQLGDWRAPVTYHDRPILTDASNKPILMHMRTTLNIDDKLIAEASRLTGVTEKTSLVRMGLEALVRREAAKRLAAMGGADTRASAAPRKRRWNRRG